MGKGYLIEMRHKKRVFHAHKRFRVSGVGVVKGYRIGTGVGKGGHGGFWKGGQGVGTGFQIWEFVRMPHPHEKKVVALTPYNGIGAPAR